MASPRRWPANRRLLLVVPIAAAVVAGATAVVLHLRSGSGASGSPVVVVAKVGSTAITSTVFDARMRSAEYAVAQGGGPQAGSPGYDTFVKGLRARVLQSLIIDAVIAEEAQFRHLAASDADVAGEVTADAKSAGGMDKLQAQLADVGGSLDQPRDEVRSRLNEERLQDLFAQQRAADIESRLRAGVDFGTLAGQLSDDDQSKAKGGDLGSLGLDQLKAGDAAFAAAALALSPGKVSDPPVRDDAGYDILRVDSATPAARNLHRILVTAPRPYTVRNRPAWFTQSVFDAIAQDCSGGRISVHLTDAGQPCGSGSPAPSPRSAAPATATTPTPTPAGAAFSPRP